MLLKGILWFALWALALLGAKEAGTDPHPLMVDAAGDWCDVPEQRLPFLLAPKPPRYPGAVQPLPDKGVA